MSTTLSDLVVALLGSLPTLFLSIFIAVRASRNQARREATEARRLLTREINEVIRRLWVGCEEDRHRLRSILIAATIDGWEGFSEECSRMSAQSWPIDPPKIIEDR